jgi:hypothetical protein
MWLLIIFLISIEASRHFPGGPNYIIACAGIEGNVKDDFILNDDSITQAQEIIKVYLIL